MRSRLSTASRGGQKPREGIVIGSEQPYAKELIFWSGSDSPSSSNSTEPARRSVNQRFLQNFLEINSAKQKTSLCSESFAQIFPIPNDPELGAIK